MNNKKLYSKVSFVLGCLSILYFLLVEWFYGSVNFMAMFLYLGLGFLMLSLLLSRSKRTLVHWLPKSIRCIVGITLTIALIFFISIEALIITHMQGDPFESNDYTIILGAGLINDQITTSLSYRLESALVVYEQDPTTTFIVSGGIGSYSTIPESTAMKDYLIEHGVPESQIIEEPYSANTLQNLTYSRTLVEQKADFTIISNDFHLFRIKLMCKDLDLDCDTVASKSIPLLQPNFIFREFFAVVKHLLLRESSL
ncbi:MAG: YdcF family protein [Erysipelotrichaceae bacterium]